MKTKLLLLGKNYALDGDVSLVPVKIFITLYQWGKRVEVIPGKESLEKVPPKKKEEWEEKKKKKCNFRVQTFTWVCFDSAK